MPKTYFVKTQRTVHIAESGDTSGAYTLIEMSHPPETGAPLHLYKNEDEGFYILEGRYRFQVGASVVEVAPGDHVFGPRNIPHRFKSLGPEDGKMLVMFTPGGVEGFFVGCSELDQNDPELRMKQAQELDDKYGLETFIGEPWPE